MIEIKNVTVDFHIVFEKDGELLETSIKGLPSEEESVLNLCKQAIEAAFEGEPDAPEGDAN